MGGNRPPPDGSGTGDAEAVSPLGVENPTPDAAIESIEIVPSGPRFIVAAITLGQLDEYPFVKQSDDAR